MLKQMGLPNAFRFVTGGRDHTDNNSSRDKHMAESRKPSPSPPAPTALPKAPDDLNFEANRLKTFENWNVSYIDKHQLALLGFYYYGPSDMVKCYFCGVEIGMWEDGDDVLTDHMRWSAYCNLLRRNDTNNVPIDATRLDNALPPAPTPDVYGASERTSTVSEGSIDHISQDDVHMYQHDLYRQGGIDAVFQGALTITTPPRATLSRPEHPEYAVEAKRIESFDDWPKTMRQKPQELSDAGLYYTGKGDKVCCFCCGGGLKDWELNDDPWEQHTMWFGNCEYVKLVKGPDYIKKMAEKKKEIIGKPCDTPSTSSQSSSSSPTPPSEDEALMQVIVEKAETTTCEKSTEVQKAAEKTIASKEAEKDSKLCKICYANEYNTIFLPCGHVIACAKCASSVVKCPACRQPFENVMRVYFS